MLFMQREAFAGGGSAAAGMHLTTTAEKFLHQSDWLGHCSLAVLAAADCGHEAFVDLLEPKLSADYA